MLILFASVVVAAQAVVVHFGTDEEVNINDCQFTVFEHNRNDCDCLLFSRIIASGYSGEGVA